MGTDAVWGYISICSVQTCNVTWYEGEFPGKEGPDHALLNFPVDGVDAGRLQLEQHLPLLRRRDRHLHMLKSEAHQNQRINGSSSEEYTEISILREDAGSWTCLRAEVWLVLSVPWGLLPLRHTCRTERLSSSSSEQPWLWCSLSWEREVSDTLILVWLVRPLVLWTEMSRLFVLVPEISLYQLLQGC